MRRRYTRGRQQGYSGGLAVVAVLFFLLSAGGTAVISYPFTADSGAPAERTSAAEYAQTWISSVVNRGGSTAGRQKDAQTLDEKLYGLLETSYPSLEVKENGVQPKKEDDKTKQEKKTEKTAKEDNSNDKASDGNVDLPPNVGDNSAEAALTQNSENPVPLVDTQPSKPVVLIYHTHATESYQPITEGNFHSLGEEGTVRQVGIEMTKALEAKGIPVLHDMTLHDSPSYNQSYSRSLQSVQSHLAKNPSIKVVIDLHRDAASYTGNAGKTVKINGETVGKFNLVVGQGNANVKQLMDFANQINKTADRLYPGFGGRIIEKQYRFNQYVHDKYILLEVGNNENTIDQVKKTGKYFADVIEECLKTM